MIMHTYDKALGFVLGAATVAAAVRFSYVIAACALVGAAFVAVAFNVCRAHFRMISRLEKLAALLAENREMRERMARLDT